MHAGKDQSLRKRVKYAGCNIQASRENFGHVVTSLVRITFSAGWSLAASVRIRLFTPRSVFNAIAFKHLRYHSTVDCCGFRAAYWLASKITCDLFQALISNMFGATRAWADCPSSENSSSVSEDSLMAARMVSTQRDVALGSACDVARTCSTKAKASLITFSPIC